MPNHKKKALIAAMSCVSGVLWAQTAPTPNTPSPEPADPVPGEEEMIVLTPFEVRPDEENYVAKTTLASGRVATDIADIGTAITVIGGKFLQDTRAKNNQTLLQYTPSTEVRGIGGNYSGVGTVGGNQDGNSDEGLLTNPAAATRVRGLASADGARDFFRTRIPWDSFNVDSIDISRGANSFLFGNGSPGGIINASTKQAKFADANRVEVEYSSYNSLRTSLDINKVLLKNELAIRLNLLRDDQNFQQDPAYSLSKRGHAAFRWEPKFLKRGSARTVIRGNIEAGRIDSNNPRSVPPVDRITPWWTALGQRTYTAGDLYDNMSMLPNRGVASSNVVNPDGSQTPNQYFQPWLGTYGDVFENPVAYLDANSGALQYSMAWTSKHARYVKPDGSLGQIRGLYTEYTAPVGVTTFGRYIATLAQTGRDTSAYPFASQSIYSAKHIQDPNVFDFYNNLLEGPNKKEWQRYTVRNLSIDQTFLNDSIGISAAHNKEWYRSGNIGLLNGGFNSSLQVDLMARQNDFTTQDEWDSGTVNPGAGRAYVSDRAPRGNQTYTSQETNRITGFGVYNFAKNAAKEDWWLKLVGEHRVTGEFSNSVDIVDNRSFQRWSSDVAYSDKLRNGFTGANQQFNWDSNYTIPSVVVYLGGPLNGKSLSDAHIPRINSVVTLPKTYQTKIFDTTWTAVGVDANDPWTGGLIQADNPANYRGWTTTTINTYDAFNDQKARDLNGVGGQLSKLRIQTRAATWQGSLWNKAFVVTGGLRKDAWRAWNVDAQKSLSSPEGLRYDYRSTSYNFDNATPIGDAPTSRTYSFVAHLDRLWRDAPFKLSISYAQSQNFQPLASRIDIRGNSLPTPNGKTYERGVTIGTKDDKYSLRVNKYTTSAKDAPNTNSYWNDGTVGFIMYGRAIYQTYAQNTDQNEMAPKSDPTSIPLDAGPVGSAAFQAAYNEYVQTNYGPKDLGSPDSYAAARALEKQHMAILRNFLTQPWLQPYMTALRITQPDATSVSTLAGFNDVWQGPLTGMSFTEDSVSTGYEVEFNAQPIRGLRLTANVAKEKATRSNVGGSAFNELAENVKTFVAANPEFGNLRTPKAWGGGADGAWTWTQGGPLTWFQQQAANLTAGENKSAAEVREWRANVIGNYDFQGGMFKGFNVGFGLRYQSAPVLGYKPLKLQEDGSILYDFDNPYRGSSEINYDAWIGYNRKLTSKINWRIQFNVRDIGRGNRLIANSVQPAGPEAGRPLSAGVYIGSHQTWSITNTFEF
ncbi:MAG: TonB-dependent receptor plug domain-containing protein [Opitutaceae bacterium]|nr:TonB-dependent receptor plug domain-containing protein [Opitutaceae bacterium]